MNKIATPVKAPEQMGMKGSSNVKAKKDGGEFQNMLANAMKNGETKAAETVREPERTEQAKPAAKPEKEAKVKQSSENQEPNEAGETAEEAGVAVAAQAPVVPENQAQPVNDEILASARAVPIQSILPAAAQPQTVQVQPMPTQSAQALQSDVPETLAAQTQIPEETAAPQQPPTQPAPQTAPTPQANANAAEQPAARQEIPASTAGQPAGETPQVQVVTQEPETQAATPIPRPAEQPEEKQAKFDEMLTKASQELGQAKAPPAGTEQPQTAVSDDAVEIPEEINTGSLPKAAATETEADPETETVPETKAPAVAETKTAPQTTVIRSSTVPKTEQRPIQEMSEPDEATLGLIAPKPQEIRAPEVARTQPEQPAQPAKIPDQAEQIRTQVIQNLETQKMEFRMQLNPQELGKIDVKMILENGKLAVEIAAVNSKSTEFLTKQAESLIASLRMNNVEVSSVNIVTASQNASGYMESQYNLDSSQNGATQQGGNGSNRASGENASQGGKGEAEGTENPSEPQRMLNYSV